ncbi:MAG: nucleoside monophosphate kinase, partial [Verrucomicrobiota bacterium]
TSIDRQLKRGLQIQAHNEKVRETGVGKLEELRLTDLDYAAAQNRYRVFKEQTWDALQSLRSQFFYHFINAQGDISEVEQNIHDELQYQSSLELDPRTFDRLRTIGLASEIIVHARQDLVKRLDTYELDHTDLFARVVDIIEHTFMPIVTRHAISGHCVVSSVDPVFHDPLALAMIIDVFSERGYHARVDKMLEHIPKHFDRETGEITCQDQWVYRTHVFFKGSDIRRGQ